MADNSDPIITLNGITLSNNIEYYKSTTNKKRIILDGVIKSGDVINVYYFSNATFINGIYTNQPTISWYITNPPQKENGFFISEVSNNFNFSSTTYTSQTEYVVAQTNYNDTLTISGNAGDSLYYRVKNIKQYETLNGDIIQTTGYSETIPITIMVNSINSY